MHLVLKELGSPEATNRRNAAFCVGELCKNGGNSVLKYSSTYPKTYLPCYIYDNNSIYLLLMNEISDYMETYLY